MKILFTLLLVFQLHFIYAQDTIYLCNDTVMWTTGYQISIKGNSIAETNNQGKIISAFINEGQYIWIAERLVKFKAGSEIKFDSKGDVILGVLADNLDIRTPAGYVSFKKGKKIRFNVTGKVTEGYLQHHTSLKSDTRNILFNADTYIMFDEIGNVINGILAERLHLKCIDDKNRTFKSGSTVEFDEEFKVIVKIEPIKSESSEKFNSLIDKIFSH